MSTTDTDIRLRACTDCIMLIANGDTSGNSRCETEEGEAEYLADVARCTEGLHLAPSSWPFQPYFLDFEDAFNAVLAGHVDVDVLQFSLDDEDVEVVGWSERDRYYGTDTESQFSMSSCDVCDEGLGGDRHPVVAWKV